MYKRKMLEVVKNDLVQKVIDLWNPINLNYIQKF